LKPEKKGLPNLKFRKLLKFDKRVTDFGTLKLENKEQKNSKLNKKGQQIFKFKKLLKWEQRVPEFGILKLQKSAIEFEIVKLEKKITRIQEFEIEA